jgi:hypothetical protein
MSSNTITTNAPTAWQVVRGASVHIALAGTFDGASVAIEQRINDKSYPVLDDTGTAVAYTDAADISACFGAGAAVRLSATGGGSGMSIDWSISSGVYTD